MNDGQRAAYEAVVHGKSIFLTGIGGSGKSFTLQQITGWAHGSGRKCGITASTGAAAVLIGGQTLHSFSGVGTAAGSKSSLISKALGRKDVTRRLNDLQMLIIDEVSMVDAELFDKLAAVFSAVRGARHDASRPFGGVQLVLCGDFAQLPPVNGDFCFQSATWQKMSIETHDLTESMRQRDEGFAAILRDFDWAHPAVTTITVRTHPRPIRFAILMG